MRPDTTTVSSAGRVLRVLASLALMTTGLFVLASVAITSPAQATKATGGLGRYVDSVEWFSWGADGTAIPNTGLSKTQTFTSAGQTVAITCTIGAVTSANANALRAYRPGNYSGDGLDDLYNIGGTGKNNQLVIGLANRVSGDAPTFDFGCSATLNGASLPLAGLVMADAERNDPNEYVQATIPAGGQWRMIDRYRNPGCTLSSPVTLTGQTLKIGGTNQSCATGPMNVAFMDGASSATNVTVKGSGVSAIALGVALDFDFGDAPASYGVAGHALQSAYTGGLVPQGTTTNINDPAFVLATPAVPALRLGNLVDSEATQLFSPDALGDDQSGSPAFNGPDDEDSTTWANPTDVNPGDTFTQSGIACTGTQAVAGWMDWNLDGTFGASEKSLPAVCAGGSVDLTWNVPSNTLPRGREDTFVRIRSSALASSITSATGIAPNGEVEDYAVTLRHPQIDLAKTATLNDLDGNGADAGDTVTYAFVVTNSGGSLLNNVTVTDPMFGGAIACGAGPLSVGASRTCTAQTHTVTQADVDAGELTNTATATGQPPRGDQVNDTSRAVVPIPSRPDVSLDKSASAIHDLDGNGPDAGDTITYSFAVQNTGNRRLTNVSLADPKAGPVTCAPTALDPGQFGACGPVDYVLTQADVQAGGVENTATVSGTAPGGATVTDSDSTSTPVARTPGLRLDKQAAAPVDTNNNGVTDAGDTIRYTFAVTNTGNTAVKSLVIDDPKLGNTTISCPTTQLAPNATTTCTSTYTITQTDVDAGAVDNRATATASSPGNQGVVSNVDTTHTPIDPHGALSLDKSVAATHDVDNSGGLDAGDTIDYAFLVTNTGNVSLSDLAITDAKTGGANCQVTTLAPGDSTTCTKTYTVTQADVDAGHVDNSATSSGTTPDGDLVTSPPDGTSTPTDATATLSFDKSVALVTDVDADGRVDAGDTVAYSFLVTNTGSVTVSKIAVVDPLVAPVNCPQAALAPGQSITCTGSLSITQVEVDAGSVTNTAHATGTNPGGGTVTSPDDSTTTTTDTTASMTLDKQAANPVDTNANGRTDAGDTIAFSFVVTNTGTQTLTGLTVVDAKVTGITCPITQLSPQASTTCHATYVITQTDVDRGSVDNTAFVTGTGGGSPIQSNQDTTSTPTSHLARLALDKSIAATHDVDGDGVLGAGDTVDYQFLVTNTGDVTTTFVGINDIIAGGADCPITTLAPGDTVTCLQTYTLTQADIDAGSLTNTAHATGTVPGGDKVDSPDDSVTLSLDQHPKLSLIKQIAATHDLNGDGKVDLGDTLDYTFVVTNIGTVTVHALVVIDAKAGAVACPTTTLAPKKSTTCTATYTITQPDVDHGSVDNTAQATGQGPAGGPVSSPPDSTSTAIEASAALGFDKAAGPIVDANSDSRVDLGDTIAYTFHVTNIGSLTVTGLHVVDSMFSEAEITCGATSLAPGADTTCTATHALTQADLDRGSVKNTAHATGDSSDGAVTSPDDSTSTPVASQAGLNLVKHAGDPVDTNHDQRIDAGDIIDYTFILTNTGSVTLHGLEVHDDLVGAIDCPTTSLAPQASVTCTAKGTLTQHDLDAGSVTNRADATAEDPSGTTVTSNHDQVTTHLPGKPGLKIVKSAHLLDRDGDGLADAGEKIRYTFKVTNTGGTTLSHVRVKDAMLSRAGLEATCPRATLAPGESMTCRAVYTVASADLDSPIDNLATAIGQGPNGGTTHSAPDTAVVPVDTPGGGPEQPPAHHHGPTLPNTGGPRLLWLELGIVALLLGAVGVGVGAVAGSRRRS